MKRLFVAGLLFVFMAVMPLFHAVADDNQTCDGQIENYVSATGTVAQNGTPTPTNPIEPVFYKQGNMVLRALKNTQGDIIYTDSYDATTGKITRRVGMRILDGTENWTAYNVSGVGYSYRTYITDASTIKDDYKPVLSSHFEYTKWSWKQNKNSISFDNLENNLLYVRCLPFGQSSNVTGFKQWLAEQYANGTPVVVYYPLATEITEDVGTAYCAPEIKIATTAYNAARFSPVKTELDSAVATIREIVTKTINQTAAIASLQADKQTRPEDACPAGKKCLLVETEENGVIVPHWFPIIEAPED